MIRTPTRPARIGVALVGVAGALTLAGCAGSGAPVDATAQTDSSSSTPGGAAAGGSASGGYANGTYTAEGSYATPESVETVVVTLTIADEVVTDVEVTGDPQARESQQYQSQFIGGISNEVVGKSLDEVSVTRVAGSSLTSGGFMQAVELIRAEASS